MTQRTDENQLDLDFLDALAGLFTRLLGEAEQLAKGFGVPAFFIKALHLIDGPLAMKELGQRMHCDPSFVTLQVFHHTPVVGCAGSFAATDSPRPTVTSSSHSTTPRPYELRAAPFSTSS